MDALIQKRRRGDDLWATAFDVAGVGIAFVDAEGRLLEVNPALCRMLGDTREALLGQPWAGALSPDGTRGAVRLAAALHEPATEAEEWPLRRRDGQTLHALASCRAIDDGDGRRVVVVTLTDISERKRTEDELRASEQRLRALSEQMRQVAHSLEARVAERTAQLAEQVGALQVARTALGASEARYRYLVDHVAESIVVLQDEQVAFCNPRLGELLGLPVERIVGRRLEEFVHPDDVPMLLERHRQRLAGEQPPTQYPLRIVRADGQVLWIDLRVTLVQWQGRPAALCLASDVGERRALEQRLRHTLDERETILDNSIVGIFFLDREVHIQWLNRSAQQMLALPQVPVGSDTVSLFATPELHADLVRRASDAFRRGEEFRDELQLRRGDGSDFWALLWGKAVGAWSLGGGSVWTVLDLSRRKALEAQLQRTSSELEVIVHNAVVGIAYSAEHRFQWVNRKLCEMLGWPPEAMVGLPTAATHVDEATWQALGAACEPVLRRGDAYEGEWALRRRDGSTFWALLHGRAVDPTRPSLHIIWTLLDVTERRRAHEDMARALEQQRELNELKARFVAMTSHEFRTPLAAILSSAELLRDFGERLPRHEREELLDIVSTSVRRMGSMVDDVLFIGRAEAQALDFSPAPLQLAPLVASVLEQVQRALDGGAAPRAAVALTLRGAEAPRTLDERLVRHILGNLVANAIKYSPASQPVQVEVDAGDGATRITVADQGIGIPEDHLPRLFEPFSRASNVGAIGGNGLGMAIVRRAVERHRGTIEVASRVGEGTRVTVSLPDG